MKASEKDLLVRYPLKNVHVVNSLFLNKILSYLLVVYHLHLKVMKFF